MRRNVMFMGKRILAIVPARSGSKGIPNKNMRILAGKSLIGWAGECLSQLSWLDGKIISTDSPNYAAEGQKFGLDAPFLRPEALSSDTAGAVETVTHTLLEAEKFYEKVFDIVLVIEPTSPLRVPEDIEEATRLLIDSGADSTVTVNRLPLKSHPSKILIIKKNKLDFYKRAGALVVSRQSLEGSFYWRNGVCYAITRRSLLGKKKVITDNTLPLVIGREIANIDEPIELEWAEFLLNKRKGA
jgi:CMP-N,N'-diacetyllegionaminic acid synthase